MSKPCLPAFDPADLAAHMATRIKRPLGDPFGLTIFGVNLTRLPPGAWSMPHHQHKRQDEFIYVLEGKPVLITDAGETQLSPGMCAGFPAGCGNAHRFINRSNADATILVIGDRTPFDEVTYPDIDNHAKAGADGKYVHTRKDGTPH